MRTLLFVHIKKSVMGSSIRLSPRTLVLAPLALCLVVMIVSQDVVVRALAVVPLALLIALRDIMIIKDIGELARVGAEAKGRKK